jgi:putative colanic acid biosynthesis acetyltransferase WcaF
VRSLADFRGTGYDKGRPRLVQAIWLATSHLVFQSWWLPARFRPSLLRLFGADIGKGVLIRHGVRIHWPWKLRVGDHSWIGEDVWVLNLEPVTIGHDVCVSQGAFLCTGSHDRHSPSFEFDNAPIFVDDHVWIAAQALILRGVTVGARSLVGARALVTRNVDAGSAIPAGSRT